MNKSLDNQRGSHEPRLRLPLLGKIVVWLLLNLLVLGTTLFLLLKAQFKFGLDAILTGPAGDRVEAVTQAIVGTLRSRPREDWPATLQSFSQAYKVHFTLFGGAGEHIAGEPVELPEEVFGLVVSERRGPPENIGRGPPPGKGPRRAVGGPVRPIPPRFTVKTQDPTRYWVGTRLPPLEGLPDRPQWASPWTLLLMTDSLYKGGMFLDLRLWIIAGVGTLLFSVVWWLPLVRSLTKSISQLTRATDEVAGGNFAVRVPATRGDELGQLGRSVNRMADRLDGFVKGQKRFLGDIAHELCSPIARMQVGLGILEEELPSNRKATLVDVREDMEEMSGLINELLSFSKASLVAKDAPLDTVPLSEIVSEVMERESATDHSIHVNVPTSIMVRARRELLRRAIANLLRNATRYAGKDGPITITAEEEPHQVQLHVRDSGPGVQEHDLQRIFDPFYRSEPSRSRETGGTGLGLAIVKSCVEACWGTVRATNLQPNGFEVVITLKRAD